MGSLHSPPPPTTPPPSPGNSIARSRIYTVYCLREPGSNVSVSNWMECYNPSDNTWSRVTSIPGLDENLVLKGFATVSIGDSIYIIGGRLCKKGKAPGSGDDGEIMEMDVQVISSVLRYNVVSDQWSPCAPLNMPRYNFACDVCDDKIYVAGGQSTLASARGISYAEMYDPSLDQWTPLPNMGTLRYKCVGVTWQGKFHVIGGFAESGTRDRIVPYVDRSSAEVFDAQNGKWDLMARMWQLDVPPNRIVSMNGTLFSSGDCLNDWKGHIEAYDGNNIWNIVEGSQQKFLPSPLCTSYANGEKRFYLTMAPIGTNLYFLAIYRIAGESPRTVSAVCTFDTSVNGAGWRSFEPMQEEGEKELCSHCCVVQLSS